MEKMKTLTIGGVTYAVCAPLTEEEKQEVTTRVLDGISYEEILAPHKQDITHQAAQAVMDDLDMENQYAPIIEKTSPASKQGALDDLLGDRGLVCLTLLGESSQEGLPTADAQVAITSVAGQLQINDHSISLPQTLRGIPDAEGQWVARDQITAKAGKVTYLQSVGEWTFHGGESEKWEAIQLTGTNFIVGINTDRISGAGVKKGAAMLCDHFTVYAAQKWANLGSNEATNTEDFTNLIFKVPKSSLGYTGTDKAQALSAWRTWLASHMPKLLYVRNTPEETDISHTDAGAALLGLLSAGEAVSWQGGVPVSFTYRADTTKALKAMQQDIHTTNQRLDGLHLHENLKVIALGDSITAASGSIGWTTHFLRKIHAQMLINAAVSGAQLADAAGNSNVLSSQVDAVTGEDVDYNPDVILIAIGTNGGIHITQEDMVAAYYSGNSLVPLENVDRNTDAGAFRYASEKLHEKYPDAVIFWCSPVHRVRSWATAEQVCAWNESLRIATAYTGQQHIDTIHCGIHSGYEISNANGDCLMDGLHPNEKGAKKIGYYIAGKVNAAIF